MEEIHKEKNVVKKKKKNWGALILIVTIVVMVLIVGLMCSGLLVKEKKDNKKPADTGSDVVEDTSNWGDYLLTNNITSVYIERSKEVSPTDPSQEYHNTVNLTGEQNKELIDNIKKYNVAKVHVEAPDYTYGDSLTIVYEKDSTSYEVKIKNGDFQFPSDKPQDKELIKVLDKNLVESDEAESGTTVLYRIVGYDELIFNEYFD